MPRIKRARTETIGRIMEQVNLVRALFGDPPLEDLHKGERHSIGTCPIANSIGHGCLIDGAVISFPKEEDAQKVLDLWRKQFPSYFEPIMKRRGMVSIRVHPVLGHFVIDFDSGQFEEYRQED